MLLPNLLPVSLSEAGSLDMSLSSTAVPAPAANGSATSITPQAASVQRSILPSAMAPQPAIANVAPGQNPFGAVASTGSPLAAPTTRPASAPQVSAATAPMSLTTGSIGAQPNMPAATDTADATGEVKVDDTALRYYAKTRDLKRLGAELRRLKALYPNWEASEDLFNQTTSIDEQPLWDMYAAGNYAGARVELARLATSNPQWKPSTDLVTKLELGESRKLIDRAYARANWTQIIATAQQEPQLLVCSEMNTMWQVGEALARNKDMARAFELYKYILTQCDGDKERLATIQKASLLLPDAGITSLMAFAHTTPDGTSEFANIGFDNLRKRLGAISSGDQLAQAPTDEELQSFASYVQSSQSSSDAGLFGWYYYNRQEWQAANAWFMAGTRYGDDLKNVEGVILTLRNLGKTADAFTLASRYATKSDDIRKEYIEIVASALTDDASTLKLADKDLDTFKSYTLDAKSALGAQALGWKLLADKGTKDAQAMFAQSVSWEPTEGGVIGMAVVAARAKNAAALTSLKTEYAEQFPALKDFSLSSGKRGKSSIRKVSGHRTTVKRYEEAQKWPFSKEYAR
jgi:hypothetical protein